jgi:methyl-accepting chemotaxis protein
MAGKWQRRNYFIKPDIQGLFILKTFLLVFFCCILYAAILAIFSTDSMTITYKDNNLLLGKTPIILFKEMLKAQGLFILSGGLGVVMFALVVSHRFAGPLYKLERCVEMMLAGDHSFTVIFRPNDKGHELAAVINRYNLKVSEDIREVRAIATALDETLARLDVVRPDAVHHDVVAASSLVRQLQEKLHGYTVHS